MSDFKLANLTWNVLVLQASCLSACSLVSFCLATETRCRESQTKVKFSFSFRSSNLADNIGQEVTCELCWLVFSVPNSAISVFTWPLESVFVIQIDSQTLFKIRILTIYG